MAKKNDLDLLDEQISLNNAPSKRDTTKPSQFHSSFLSESSAKKAEGLYTIPIDNLVQFTKKGDGDFSEWEDADLQELADKMDDSGAYEPILVRQMPSGGKFEILAGEHRVKASRLKGLKEIKAIVFRACSDEKAMDIFLLTNLQRRKTKISDAIYGWSMFAAAHPTVRSSKSLETVTSSITEIANTDKMPITLSQYYRFVKMANLISELIKALDNHKISIRVGYELSRLNQEEQRLFLPYLSSLSEPKMQKLIKDMQEQDFLLNTSIIEQYMLNKKTKDSTYDSSLRKGMKNIRIDISKRIKPDYYSKVDEIMKEALDIYLQNHPEISK